MHSRTEREMAVRRSQNLQRFIGPRMKKVHACIRIFTVFFTVLRVKIKCEAFATAASRIT